jgi:hypothetical protein
MGAAASPSDANAVFIFLSIYSNMILIIQMSAIRKDPNIRLPILYLKIHQNPRQML